MQLTSFTDYGLRTLMYLARKPETKSSVKEVADYYGISRNHLVKIVHKLAQLGYIQSTKGKGGGITIAPDTLNISLADIVRELEPSMDLVECFDKVNNTCRITNSCQLKHYLFEAKQSFMATLAKYTLADTIN